MAIGDVNSSEIGSGARYNEGKTPFRFIPAAALRLLWRDLLDYSEEGWFCSNALEAVDLIERGDIEGFRDSLAVIGGYSDEAARVFEYGSQKYAIWNWAKGMPWSVPAECVKRHIESALGGEELDPESKLPHRGHILCNLIMLEHYVTYYPSGNDFPVFKVEESQPVTTKSVPYSEVGDNQWAGEEDYRAHLRWGAREDCDGI